MNDLQTILHFLHAHPLATLATVHKDARTRAPEAALVAFAEFGSLELVFETFNDSRKYANLLGNPRVALVVGWDVHRHVTLQYEGVARQVSGDEAVECRGVLLQKKTPCTEAFLRDPRVRLFRVSPVWIALSDYTAAPPKVIELKFDGGALRR